MGGGGGNLIRKGSTTSLLTLIPEILFFHRKVSDVLEYSGVTVSFLFSSETSEKYKKAKEWGIVCTNARWISDIMTGESFNMQQVVP